MRFFWLVLFLSLGTSIVHADVYKCLDGQGRTHYQNTPCTGNDSQPILRTEEQPSSTGAQPRRDSPRRAPAAAGQESLRTEPKEARQQARRDALRYVRIEEVHEQTGPSRFRLRGKVRNEGKQRVDSVHIYVEWQDNAGKVLDVSSDYVGRLEPGQAQRWSAFTRREAQRIQYHIYLSED